MFLVLYDKSGKSGQIGIRIGLFVEVFLDHIRVQIEFLCKFDSQILWHLVEVIVPDEFPAKEIPTAVVHQDISQGLDLLQELVPIVIAAIGTRAQNTDDGLPSDLGGGMDGRIGILLYVRLGIGEKILEDAFEEHLHPIGTASGPVEIQQLYLIPVLGQFKIVCQPIFDYFPGQYLRAQTQGLGQKQLFPFFVQGNPIGFGGATIHDQDHRLWNLSEIPKRARALLGNMYLGFVYRVEACTAKSTNLFEKPASLSYQQTTLKNLGLSSIPASASKTQVLVSPTKSWETTRSSV